MINQIFKDVRRKISINKSYFWVLVITISLGIILYSGSTMLSKSANVALKDHYNKMNIMDIYIKTNINFNNNDIDKIKNIPHVNSVLATKSLNVTSKINGNNVKVKLTSLPYENKDYINKVTIIKGKYPSTINEALVEKDFYKNNNISLNELITLSSEDNDNLRAKKIKIVGIVNESYQDNETSDKTSMYLLDKEFNFNYYNNVYIKVDDDKNNKKVIKEINNIYKETKKNQIEDAKFDSDLMTEKLSNIYSSSLPQDELNKEISYLTKEADLVKNKLNEIENDNLKIIERKNVESFKLYKNSLTKTGNILMIFSFIYLISIIILAFILLLKLFKKDKKEIQILKRLGYTDAYIIIKYILIVGIIDLISIIISIFFSKIYVRIIGLLYQNYYGIKITKIISNNSILLSSIIIIIISIFITFISYKEKKLFRNIKFLNILKNNYQNILITLMIILSINFIFTGYQIFSNINKSINKEYNNVMLYDLEVTKKNNTNIKTSKKYSIFEIKEINLKENNMSLIILKNNNNLRKFINIKEIPNDNGVIITSNLANTLNLKINDYIKINKKVKLKINYITKDYVNNYVYMSPILYKNKINDSNIYYNKALINIKNKKDINKIQYDLINEDNIYNVTSTTELVNSYKKSLLPVKVSMLIISITGNIILLLLIYILLLEMVNDKNIKLKKLGYYNKEIIKMYYKKYKSIIIISIICGITLSYITSMVSINSLSKNLIIIKNNFCILPYVLGFINFIFVYIIINMWLKKMLKISKM